MVEDPLPPEMEEGLKLMVVPLPCPDAVNATVEMVPWVFAVVMVEVPEEPLVMLRVVGLAAMVKLDGAAVTVRLTVVV